MIRPLLLGTGSLVALCLWAACGSSDPGPTRSYRLASSGSQLVVSGAETGLLLTDADLPTDVEVVAVHQEYYGVPWDAFAGGAAPPSVWAGRMSRISSSARAAGKQVFLSVSPLDGNRSSLAPRRQRACGRADIHRALGARQCQAHR